MHEKTDVQTFLETILETKDNADFLYISGELKVSDYWVLNLKGF